MGAVIRNCAGGCGTLGVIGWRIGVPIGITGWLTGRDTPLFAGLEPAATSKAPGIPDALVCDVPASSAT